MLARRRRLRGMHVAAPAHRPGGRRPHLRRPRRRRARATEARPALRARGRSTRRAPATPTITGGPTGIVGSAAASADLRRRGDGAVRARRLGLRRAAPRRTTSPASRTASHAFAVRAVDAVGNQSAASAPRAWVVDTTKPALSVPGGVTAEADGPFGSVVHYDVSATDRGAPLPPAAIQCEPHSGLRFPLGRTTVGCAATDSVGNRSEGAFSVLVRDTTPPVINAPDVDAHRASRGWHPPHRRRARGLPERRSRHGPRLDGDRHERRAGSAARRAHASDVHCPRRCRQHRDERGDGDGAAARNPGTAGRRHAACRRPRRPRRRRRSQRSR